MALLHHFYQLYKSSKRGDRLGGRSASLESTRADLHTPQILLANDRAVAFDTSAFYACASALQQVHEKPAEARDNDARHAQYKRRVARNIVLRHVSHTI